MITLVAPGGPLLAGEMYDRAAMERLRLSRFVLIRNDGGEIGERFGCRLCGTKHAYLTRGCIEMPFRGLADGLRAFVRVSSSDRAQAIAAVLPDFAADHPRTARQLAPRDGSGSDVYALSVGLAEPITEAQARALCLRISLRGYTPPRLH